MSWGTLGIFFLSRDRSLTEKPFCTTREGLYVASLTVKCLNSIRLVFTNLHSDATKGQFALGNPKFLPRPLVKMYVDLARAGSDKLQPRNDPKKDFRLRHHLPEDRELFTLFSETEVLLPSSRRRRSCHPLSDERSIVLSCAWDFLPMRLIFTGRYAVE